MPKRTLDESEEIEDLIPQKNVRVDETDSDSDSSDSTSLSSSDDETAASTTSPVDFQLPFGPLSDSLQLPSGFDTSKYSKLRDRRWVFTNFGKMIRGNCLGEIYQKGFKFTVASYNLLAQNLLQENNYLYVNSNSRYLEWSYRRKHLLAEITYYKPDILCCQEIQDKHYEDFFCPEIEKLGYQGSFKKRTRAMRDGCATFFKKSVFECEAVVPVEYLVADVASLDRDNVALLLLLQPKCVQQRPAPKLCVANTHLLFNPRRGDVKLAQLMKLLAEIDQLTYQPNVESSYTHRHHPVLLCGDMNMEPFSRLYQFVRDGVLRIGRYSAAELSGQRKNKRRGHGHQRPMAAVFLGQNAGLTDQSQYESVCLQRCAKVSSHSGDAVSVDVPCGEKFSTARPARGIKIVSMDEMPVYTQGSGIVSHVFSLHSVYSHFTAQNNIGHSRAREVTTCHGLANCTVDYIFYTPSVFVESRPENDLQSSRPSQTSNSNESADEDHCKLSTSCQGDQSASSNGESRSAVSQECSGSRTTDLCPITNHRLSLIARLQLLSDEEMGDIGELPNEFISSDHMILAAEFLLTSE